MEFYRRVELVPCLMVSSASFVATLSFSRHSCRICNLVFLATAIVSASTKSSCFLFSAAAMISCKSFLYLSFDFYVLHASTSITESATALPACARRGSVCSNTEEADWISLFSSSNKDSRACICGWHDLKVNTQRMPMLHKPGRNTGTLGPRLLCLAHIMLSLSFASRTSSFHVGI